MIEKPQSKKCRRTPVCKTSVSEVVQVSPLVSPYKVRSVSKKLINEIELSNLRLGNYNNKKMVTEHFQYKVKDELSLCKYQRMTQLINDE